MNPRTYDIGRAADLDRERPTVADLQRAQAHALRSGDRRRAAAYALVVSGASRPHSATPGRTAA